MTGTAEGLDAIAAEAAAFEVAAAPMETPAAPPAPVVDPAQEWRDAANMGCGLILAMRPELKAEWTQDKLDALGDALHKCAERYGWTVAGIFGHPLVGLAFAVFPLGASLVLTAMAGIVLGMGMPTTPAYIVMVSLLVPALIKLGAIAPAAHMFAFYFAILSAITPPVALAVFAAASLGKTDLWKSGWEAVRIGAAGFIVPFMFVYEPSILMIGDWMDIASAFITATTGT